MSGPTEKRQFLRPLTSQERAVAEQNQNHGRCQDTIQTL